MADSIIKKKNRPEVKSQKKAKVNTAEIFKLAVYDTQGKQAEVVELDKHVFDGEINQQVLYQAVLGYQANQRKGCAATKTRGEVSGGGVKPWKQKGTGRARAGSIRSPVFRHGGVVFGPHPRDFSYSLPPRIRLLALKSMLNARLKNSDIVLIDSLGKDMVKTKDVAGFLLKLGLSGKILAVLETKPELFRCARNISNLCVARPEDVSAYDILRYKKLLITKDALKKIVKRIIS